MHDLTKKPAWHPYSLVWVFMQFAIFSGCHSLNKSFQIALKPAATITDSHPVAFANREESELPIPSVESLTLATSVAHDCAVSHSASRFPALSTERDPIHSTHQHVNAPFPLASPAHSSESHVGQKNDCLETDRAWKESQENQNQELNLRLKSLEQQLFTTQGEFLALHRMLNSSTEKVGQLTFELEHWQNETRRLEKEMIDQQQADLKSLDELTTAVNAILERQRPIAKEVKR